MNTDQEKLMIKIITVLAAKLPQPLVIREEELLDATGHVILTPAGSGKFELVILPDYVSIGEEEPPLPQKVDWGDWHKDWLKEWYQTNSTSTPVTSNRISNGWTFGYDTNTSTATRIDIHSRSP